MKILALCGSARQGGNTETALKVVLNEAEALGAETQFIRVNDKNLRGCTGCYGCVKAGRCVVLDDFGDIFDAMAEADCILMGTPVYHASVTAELKAVMDRAGFSGRWAKSAMQEKGTGYAWNGTTWSGKLFAPVTAARRTGHTFAVAQLLLWASCNDLITIGNTYWNVSVSGKGGAMDALDDEEGIGNLKGLATRIVAAGKALRQ
ncbi:flavodoxin family protein [Ruminococcaceae bacterium OttesenSCG-928-A16]|nr:flavodoxin family protein [Ruminococcaceae bacterium OttesenSCG-928-A16]